MKVSLGPLARSALEARAGSNLAGAIDAALAHYVDRLDSDHPPAAVPGFLRAHGSGIAVAPSAGIPSARIEIEVPVEARIERALIADADRQGVSPTELAGHAVLVYLAAPESASESESASASA